MYTHIQDKLDDRSHLQSKGCGGSCFPNITLDFSLSDYRTVFHFASVNFKWALTQRRWWCFWWCFWFLGYGAIIMASSLHDRALTCICGQHSQLFLHTVISGRVPESMHGFSGLPLVDRVCSRLSESFDLCTVDKILKIFSIFH